MPGPVKLPKAAKEAFAVNPIDAIIGRLQWKVDPPYLRGVREEVLREIGKIHMKYLADEANLESQKQAAFAKAMQQISEKL